MSTHVNPVFTDRSVHMMMVVLALFHRYSQCWKKNIHDQNNSTVSIQMKEMWHIKRALFHIIIVTCTLHSEDQDESVRRIHEVIKKFDLSDCDSEHLSVITMCDDNDGNMTFQRWLLPCWGAIWEQTMERQTIALPGFSGFSSFANVEKSTKILWKISEKYELWKDWMYLFSGASVTCQPSCVWGTRWLRRGSR